MSIVTVKAGAVEPLTIQVKKASDGTMLTGSTNLRVDIRRATDNYFLDFADGTFKASAWTTKQATLTEISATDAPGHYHYVNGLGGFGVDTTGWSTTAYIVTFYEVTTTLAVGAPQIGIGEIRVGGSIENLDTRIPAALVSGRVDASVGAVQSGAIGAAAFSAGAITSTVLADDAITAAKIAASAITSSEAPALANLDATVSSRLATAGYTAPPSTTDIWTAGTRTLTGIGSSGIASQASVDALPAAPSAAAVASQVWSTALPGAFTSGQAGHTVGTNLDATVGSRLPTSSYASAPSAASIASQVLGTAVPGAFGAGTLGYVVGTNLDVVLSTRLAASAYTVPPTASAIATQVWATAEGSPSAGTFGYGLQLLRMGLTNRLEEAAGNPGTLRLYADDGTTLHKTWQLRDASGGAVTAQSGSPAKRGAAT